MHFFFISLRLSVTLDSKDMIIQVETLSNTILAKMICAELLA